MRFSNKQKSTQVAVMQEILEITNLKNKQRISKYLTYRRRIQQLIKKESINFAHEEKIAYYITRTSEKAKDIERDLKYEGIIKFGEKLSEWPTKRLRDLLL